MKTYGVILAGGGGRRLGGVDKTKVRLGTQSLGTLIRQQLAGQTDALGITNSPYSDTSDLPYEVANLTDSFSPQIGPLGGISAGYDWAKSLGANENDYLLIAPVDTPNFPKHFVQHALHEMGNADVLVARHNDQEYPTCSLWRFGAAANIESSRPTARNNSVRGYLDNLYVTYKDFSALCERNPFKNVNKISDLIELGSTQS